MMHEQNFHWFLPGYAHCGIVCVSSLHVLNQKTTILSMICPGLSEKHKNFNSQQEKPICPDRKN